jgi:hypothetical protein
MSAGFKPDISECAPREGNRQMPDDVGARPAGAPTKVTHIRQRIILLLRYYPVSILVIAPYAVLVAPSAVYYRNPDRDFILRLLLVAMASAAMAETITKLHLRSASRKKSAEPEPPSFDYVRAFLIARVVAVTSILAAITAAVSGHCTIATQITGHITSSWVAPVSTMFSGWRYLAIGSLLYSVMAGHARAASLYRWSTALVFAQLFILLLTALSAQMISYLTFVASAGAITGVIRSRHIVVAMVRYSWPGRPCSPPATKLGSKRRGGGGGGQ